MSKVDALRALREARHAQASAAPPAAKAVTPKAVTPKATKATPLVSPSAEEGTCGHRNMSGRSCTRPQGHAETSHRYTPKG